MTVALTGRTIGRGNPASPSSFCGLVEGRLARPDHLLRRIAAAVDLSLVTGAHGTGVNYSTGGGG